MRKETITRGLYIITKIHGGLYGATFGTPSVDCFPVIKNPHPGPSDFPPNPEFGSLVAKMTCLLDECQLDNKLTLSWTNRKVDLIRLFYSLISFWDDHNVKVAREFYPVDQCLSYIAKVIQTSREFYRPLDVTEQFQAALELTGNSCFSATILAHSASRAIGRNKDHRVSQKFVFSPSEMLEWGQSIARFESTDKYDPPGDTYHFWATCAMGMAVNSNEAAKNSFAKIPIAIMFRNGSNIMSAARTMLAGNPLYFKHKETDRLGLQIGSFLAKRRECVDVRESFLGEPTTVFSKEH